ALGDFAQPRTGPALAGLLYLCHVSGFAVAGRHGGRLRIRPSLAAGPTPSAQVAGGPGNRPYFAVCRPARHQRLRRSASVGTPVHEMDDRALLLELFEVSTLAAFYAHDTRTRHAGSGML